MNFEGITMQQRQVLSSTDDTRAGRAPDSVSNRCGISGWVIGWMNKPWPELEAAELIRMEAQFQGALLYACDVTDPTTDDDAAWLRYLRDSALAFLHTRTGIRAKATSKEFLTVQ